MRTDSILSSCPAIFLNLPHKCNRHERRGQTTLCRPVRSFSTNALQLTVKYWAPPSPGRNISQEPSCCPPPSPVVLLLPDVQSHRVSLTFFLLFLYSFVLRICTIYSRIISFAFSVPPRPSLFSILTHFGLVRLELEMQFSTYHRY